tara:strand:+ start:55 stop:597 length:543 start_codon:yes stop_codon:yes gene_type:complete
MIELFWDDKRGSFFATKSKDSDVIVRQKNLLDGAIPSGNSVALYGLQKIASYSNDKKMHDIASKLSSQLGQMAKKFPINLTQFLANHLSLLTDELQIVIVNPGNELDVDNELISFLLNYQHENKIIFYISSAKDLDMYNKIIKKPGFLPKINNSFEVYICNDYKCNLPIKDFEGLRKVLL